MKKMKKTSYIFSAIALGLLILGVLLYVITPSLQADLPGALKQISTALVSTITFKGANNVVNNGVPSLLIFDIVGIVLFALFAIMLIEGIVLSISKKRADLIGNAFLWLVTGFCSALFFVMSFVNVADEGQVGILFEGNKLANGEWYHDVLGFLGQAFGGGNFFAGLVAALSFLLVVGSFIVGLIGVILSVSCAVKYPGSKEAQEELKEPIEEKEEDEPVNTPVEENAPELQEEQPSSEEQPALEEEPAQEEKPAQKAEEQKPVIIQNFYNGSMGGKPNAESGVTASEIRSIIREELKALAPKEEEGAEDDCMTIDDIRLIIREEIVSALKGIQVEAPAKEEPAPAPVVEEPTPVKEEPAPEAVEPEPVVVEEVPAPVVEAPAPEASEDEEEAQKEGKSVIRLSFSEKMVKAEVEIMEAYNELKAYALGYGLKSRISNAGDTFRLHLKTYLRINIVGKNLKLYYALNPADYKDSTIPVKDVSKKEMYAEIPLCFKVRSGLSIKRAKMLIDDVCGKEGLVADKQVELRDFAREVSDSVEEDE